MSHSSEKEREEEADLSHYGPGVLSPPVRGGAAVWESFFSLGKKCTGGTLVL